jgi:hypothetical protein
VNYVGVNGSGLWMNSEKWKTFFAAMSASRVATREQKGALLAAPLRFEIQKQIRPPEGGRYKIRFYSSLATVTFTLEVISRWSLMGISYSPTTLIGSVRTILRFSISKPWAASASATSPDVTEPKS